MLPVRSRARGLLDRATLLLFAGALCALALDQLVRPDEARDARHENRQPEPRPGPPFESGALGVWPSRYERYFKDTFGLRDRLLCARNTALLRLHLAPTAHVEPTPDGWIFYRGDAT
jgi:hypothetical protein